MTDELEVLARRAFLALGLRDYARFDVRLSPGAGGEATGGDMAWPEGKADGLIRAYEFARRSS